jgi:hypothetical protein
MDLSTALMLKRQFLRVCTLSRPVPLDWIQLTVELRKEKAQMACFLDDFEKGGLVLLWKSS